MTVFDNAGETVCDSCGDYWRDHAAGGTCRKIALTEAERAALLVLSAGNRPRIKGPDTAKAR